MLAALLALTYFSPPVQAPAAPSPPGHVRAELVPSPSTLSPGGTGEIFVHFTIAPLWHMYWDGQNDTGIPPTFQWELPAGWTISAPEFPAPLRHVLPGEILDYIYEKELICRFGVTVSKDVQAGTTAKVQLKASWLECADICVPGNAALDSTLRVEASDGKSDPAATQLSQQFQRQKPRAWGELKDAQVKLEKSTLTWTVEGATRLEFFPGSRCSPVKDALHSAAADRNQLTLELEGEIPPTVEGILAVYRTKRGPAEYYAVSRDLISKQAHPTPQTQPEREKGAKEETPRGR
jgi:thiol:disulfide interchange protein DsbD